MTKNIFEEESTSETESSGGDAKIRKQARQLAYDVRYKVKQSLSKGEESNDASLKRAYLQQLNSSPAPGAVKRVAKKMLVGESYDFVDITETAKESVDKILSSVFVKKTELEDVDGNSAFEVTDFVFGEEKSDREKKYKVRVTGKKGKKTYVRMADRKDIDKLRKGDEVSSVEMTGYGVPNEEKGKKKVVKKAKKDFDGDGKLESPEAEYKGSKDKAIKKAVAKEEVVQEADSLSKQVSRWEANRQRRMKASGTYERPNWIPRDQDHSDSYGSSKGQKRKPQKTHANLQNEDIADILARLEKKRISKGGDPDASPLGKKTGQAMKAKQDAVRKKAGVKTEEVELDEVAITGAALGTAAAMGATSGLADLATKRIVKNVQKWRKEKKAAKASAKKSVDEGLGWSWAAGSAANAVGQVAKAYTAKQMAKAAIVGGALSGAGSIAGGALNYAASRNNNKKNDTKKKLVKVKEELEFNEVNSVLYDVYSELIQEGFSEDDVKYGMETALTLNEGYYDSAVAASKAASKGNKPKVSLKDKIKSAAKKAITSTSRAAGKVVKVKADIQAAPGKAKKKVTSYVDKVKGIAKAGYKSGRGPVEKTTTYRNVGKGRKEKIGEEVVDEGLLGKVASAGGRAAGKVAGKVARTGVKVAGKAAKTGAKLAGKAAVGTAKLAGRAAVGTVKVAGKAAAGAVKGAVRGALRDDVDVQSIISNAWSLSLSEHHQVDANGKVIEHGDATPSSVEEGLVDIVKKGAKRHAKAVEKKKIKNRKAVPYAALGASYQPEDEMVEDYHRGTGEKVVARTKKWMDKKGQKGAPGLDAMKARTAEHKAKRGVKEDFVTEVIEDDNPNANVKKIDVMKGKNKVKINPNMGEQVENKVDDNNPDLAQKSKQANMLKKRVLMQKLKAVRSGAGDSIMASHMPEGEVVEAAGCETKKIENKGKKTVDPEKNPVVEAKVDKGRSDYGKATIRNWRHSGPSTVEPAMFDPENKRGKTIDKRRAEHKARRGVKGAKVTTYTKEEVVGESHATAKKPSERAAIAKLEAILKRREDLKKQSKGVKEEVVGEAKVEKGYISNLSKAQARNERKFGKKGSTTPQGYFGQKPSQAAELSKKRTDEHKAKRGVKTKGVKEEVVTELNRYGKETGKATGSINKRAGTPVKKGGSTDDKALTFVRNMIRKETGRPEGQRKKAKGEKGRVQYGDRKGTPADTIAKRRQASKDAEKLMRDTRGT